METPDEIGHLSIGEVLSLLQTEFPDVTISKIRFLEAQGLIDPERTPSGYRKFYEVDIVRLRWILRQQRDHFLPLKVIKAKLEQGGDIDFDSSIAVQPNLWSDDPQPTPVAPPMESPWTPKAPGRRVATGAGAAVAPTAESSPSDTIVSAGAPTATDNADVDDAAAPTTDDAAAVVAGALRAPAAPSSSTSSTSSPEPAEAPAPADGAAADGDAGAWLAALQESPRRGTPASRPVESASIGIGRGVRFGLAEVVEVTGVDAEAIDGMITYGLVTPMQIGGEPTFDASSVAVVRAVAQFLARGVEPRHLRMFKNAAEREAGFYEQMILPLLKQRNPKARERASSTLGELTNAGDDLSRALVRQALRSHLGD